MPKAVSRLLGTCLMLATACAWATDHVWLIGGGGDLESSQAQIEANVIWARDVLQALPGERELHVYFTDGDDPAKDVKEWRRPADTPASLQPLARVFNAYWSNGEHYRNHRLGTVAGGTEASTLRARLESEFRMLRAGDRMLLVFNGHGGFDARDTRRNTIQLWGPTEMTVGEVQALLDRVDPDVAVRFLFTQCYSGAFALLARDGTNRCGFLAEAEDRQAEGCSASVELGDYRDYSTYFFAALGGKDRNGDPLPTDPDVNGDGRVSLREAHLYALGASRSSDLPRSTSEVYLEEWLPWYLRWMQASGEHNEYTALARELSQSEGFAPGSQGRKALGARRQALGRERRALLQEQERLADEIPGIRAATQDEVLRRWPESRYPYTQAYQQFLGEDLAAAQHFIVHHPRYRYLVNSQDRYWALEQDLLTNERAITQLDKIERLTRLGRSRATFERFASEAHRRRYQELLACEELGI